MKYEHSIPTYELCHYGDRTVSIVLKNARKNVNEVK